MIKNYYQRVCLWHADGRDIMQETMIRQCRELAAFLSEVLGPCYETVLYDLTLTPPSVVAIYNGSISGRAVGSPMTSMLQKMIADGVAKDNDWIANYRGLAANGKTLRCSTHFIKDEAGELIGLLCVNFDDTRYLELSHNIFSMVHPDHYIKENISIALTQQAEDGNLSDSVSDAVDEAMILVIGTPHGIMNYEQKLEVISILNRRNIFQIKGAVSVVARRISASQASVYRYLNEVRSREH